VRALIVGYGKMGKAIEAVLKQRGHEVVACYGRREIEAPPSSPSKRIPGLSSDFPACDLAFEFTAPDCAPGVVVALLERGIPVVSGTTGWDLSEATRIAIERSVPFLHSTNFSLGVAAMRRGAAALAAALAPFREFHPGLVERHHSAKRDAPSGTAKTLAADVAHASGRREVPIVSLRQGGVPGEHALFFEGDDETLELVHRARSRGIFAAGAVRAAEWLLTSGRKGPVAFDDFFDGFTNATRRGDVS
jgi:4-hydroxy-tetrahydrodipicolinate reductase